MKSPFGCALASAMLMGNIGTASAADMAVKAPPIPVVAPYSWTGCYVGVEGGGSWGNNRSTSNGTNNSVVNGTQGSLKAESDISGGIVGGTLGCNYQVNQWVFGIEGDYSWSGEKGGSNLVNPPFVPSFREDVSQNYIATIRGRLGWAFRPAFMVYGTAGAAFADLRIHEFDPTAALGTPASIGATETHQYAGWTVGVGFEWGFAPNWSAKAEYLYMDLGRQGFFQTTATGCCTFQNTRLTDNVVRAGINYNFNWARPVAKY